MFDFAARSASRTVRAIDSARLTMSRKPSSPAVAARGAAQLVLERVDPERILDRHLKPLRADRLDDEIDRACAHGGNDRLDRAMRRLDNCGNGDVALAHAREHAHAVEIGHHQVENEEIDRLLVVRLQPRERGLSGFERLDLVAEPPRHRLQQAALDGIVVDNKDEGGHRNPGGRGAASPRVAPQSDIRVNAMLMPSDVLRRIPKSAAIVGAKESATLTEELTRPRQ